MTAEFALEAVGLSKRFGVVQALGVLERKHKEAGEKAKSAPKEQS